MPPCARMRPRGRRWRKSGLSGTAPYWTDCRPRRSRHGRARPGRAAANVVAGAEMVAPNRGEVWLTDLSPVRGHEQAGRRPVLIVSEDLFNQGPAGLVILLPITSTVRGIPSHVEVVPPEAGLKGQSAVVVEGVPSHS